MGRKPSNHRRIGGGNGFRPVEISLLGLGLSDLLRRASLARFAF